jgi:choline dehydrogenase-like flavoprotein
MIADARSVSQDEIVETDVCIVGAGVAGVTLACEFAGQGFQVLVLESGALQRDDDTQALYEGENVGHPYYPLHEARARFCGGSANYWDIDLGDGRFGGLRLRPLDPIDFEQRDWIPYSGWPFGRSRLEPFYERAQATFDIKEPSYATDLWDDPGDRPRLGFTGDTVETVIFKFGAQDVFFRRRDEIVRRADNVIVLVYANVVEIETDASGRVVQHVRVACLQGNRFSVSAKHFILATGGIETPRLMLASNKVQPAGLGNDHDLVGRFFMEHLHFTSGLYVPPPRDGSSMGLYDRIHLVRGVPIVGKLALGERVLRRERLLNQNIQLLPWHTPPAGLYPGVVSRATDSLRAIVSARPPRRQPDRFGGHLANVVAGLDDVATHVYRKVRRTIAARRHEKIRVFRLAHMTEQVPNPDSRVSLAPTRDRLGQNQARLDWRLSPVDILSVLRTQRIVDAELRRARLGELRIELRDDTPPLGPVPIGVHGGYHHMGTTRMHTDPRHGVVDPDCRVHGLANLFIGGPSVFPTGGYANPVLTIVALSLRLADHVKGLMEGQA